MEWPQIQSNPHSNQSGPPQLNYYSEKGSGDLDVQKNNAFGRPLPE